MQWEGFDSDDLVVSRSVFLFRFRWMCFGVVLLEIPREAKLTGTQFTTVRVFRGMNHHVRPQLIGMRKKHRTHGAGVFPEVLIVRSGVLIQNGFGEECLAADVAAVSPHVGMAVEMVLEAILKYKGKSSNILNGLPEFSGNYVRSSRLYSQ